MPTPIRVCRNSRMGSVDRIRTTFHRTRSA
jgi:hypothetical protein